MTVGRRQKASKRNAAGWCVQRLLCVAVLIGASTAGCRRSENAPGPASQPAAAATDDPNKTEVVESSVDEETLRQLRAVPYAAWTSDETPPENTGVVKWERDRTQPGYAMFASRGALRAQLLDNAGRVLHEWGGDEDESDGFWGDVELLDDGSLLVIGASSNIPARQPTDRYLRKLAWDGSLVWQSAFPAHHDVEALPDGRILTLTSQDRSIAEFPHDAKLIDDRVVICSPSGEIEETYSLYDLFSASEDIWKQRFSHPSILRDRFKAMDAYHLNSADWIDVGDLAATHPMYKTGNILVSVRNQNFVGIFDRDARRFVWGWGAGALDNQHSVRMLPNGNVSIFDNGLGRKHTRVLEVDPRTNEIVWIYETNPPADFYVWHGGSAQWLPNDHYFVSDSKHGRLFETTRDREIVWEYLNPIDDPNKPRRATIQSAKKLPPAMVEAILAAKEH